MRNNRVSITQIRELELDIANLEVTVSDKKRLLAELKLEFADSGPQEVPNVTPSRSPPRHYNSPTPRVLSTSPIRLVPVDTGLLNSQGQPISIGDIVALRTPTTGKFAKYFKRGDQAKVVGTTKDSLLKIHPVPPRPFTSTTRSASNVIKLRSL